MFEEGDKPIPVYQSEMYEPGEFNLENLRKGYVQKRFCRFLCAD
jgi:hypothetical protein